MAIKFKNFATSTIANAGGIAAGDLSFDVPAGHGARFPTLAVGDYFYGVFVDAAANREVVKVTGIAVDTLTIVRAQDDTTARAFVQGDLFELRLVGAALDDLHQETVDATDAAVLAAQAAQAAAEGAAATAAADVEANIASDVMTFTNKTSGDGFRVTGGPLDLGPADAGDEGAEIVLRGAGVHGDVSIDRFQKQTRFFGSSPDDFELQLLNTGAGKFNAMIDGTVNVGVLQINGVNFYETFSTAAGGDLTGNLYFVRVGKMVTLTWGVLTHASSIGAFSASVIPASMEPVVDSIENTFSYTTASRCQVRIFKDTLRVYFFHIDAARTSIESGSISWVTS